MLTEGTKKPTTVYSEWFGKSVILLVAVRKCHIPFPCSIVGETSADVRVRAADVEAILIMLDIE